MCETLQSVSELSKVFSSSSSSPIYAISAPESIFEKYQSHLSASA